MMKYAVRQKPLPPRLCRKAGGLPGSELPQGANNDVGAEQDAHDGDHPLQDAARNGVRKTRPADHADKFRARNPGRQRQIHKTVHDVADGARRRRRNLDTTAPISTSPSFCESVPS